MPGPRSSRVSPTHKRGRRVQFEMPQYIHIPFIAYCTRQKRKPRHVAQDAIVDLLRSEGLLPPLKTPQDFQEGEDAYMFPWTQPHSGRFAPTRMPFWSKDDTVATWAKFLRAYEYETERRIIDICEDFGISVPYAHRVWLLFDRWRRGEAVRAGYDPLAALQKKHKRKPKAVRRTKKS